MTDPFLSGNPKTPAEYKDLAKLGKVDLVLVTHGHGDHVGRLVGRTARATRSTSPSVPAPRCTGRPKFVVPMHYGTTPVLKGTPQEYMAALGQTATKVFPINPGDRLEF